MIKYLQYLLIIFTHNLVKHLNLRFLLVLSYIVGPIYYLLSFKNSINLHKRISRFQKFGEISYSPIKVKINYVKYWLETLWLTKSNFQNKILNNVEIVNEHYITTLKTSNIGFIFALPHVGNWEMAIPVGNKLDLKLLAVAEPLDNQKVMTWFKSLREELGCEIILGGKGQNTFNLVQEKINNGYHVCLLSERSVNKSGVGTEFFGDLAAFPKGPVALALKTGVPIVPATFIKINNKYTLYFEKPFYVPHFENEAQSIQQGMKVLAKSFEKLISLDANQWHSIQPVWTDEY
ncbi:MAG: lysophospholipid acyltransferase family protein [Actinobacteria bacterium]|jgi:lauroyl/myristoyl acyltransferase|nr:lysophospholipid acyltransferase family protein [Actinomycetota bacterium]